MQPQRSPAEPREAIASPAGVSLRAVHTLFARLANVGVDPAVLLRSVGVDPGLLRQVEARLPQSTLSRVWDEAERQTRDPRIVLHAMELFHGLQIDMLPDQSEYLMIQLFASSPDARTALERLQRYYGIVDDETRVSLDATAGRALAVCFHFPSAPPPSRRLVEHAVGLWARTLRGIVLEEGIAIDVELSAPPPEGNLAEYDRIFGARVHFGATRDAISVPERWLKAKLRTARPLLEEQLERRALAIVEKLSVRGSLAQRVRAALRAELRDGTPTVERTARHLRTSARSLSRHLREEGTSHGALLDEVRAELAARYLRDDGLSAVDVAGLLGFSDASTFNRAFRRWFGCTPAELRARGTH